jgi:hypothetical protein
MANKKQATDSAEELAKHIIVDVQTGEVVEEWRPKEPPAPKKPRKPSLQEQIDDLRARVEKLEK